MLNRNIKETADMSSPDDLAASSLAAEMRAAMKSSLNPAGKPISLRQLAATVGCSYEHMRKVAAGEPVLSRGVSDALAQALGLAPERLWRLAEEEKARRRFPTLQLPGSIDDRLVRAWSVLGGEDRACLLRVASALAVRASASRHLE